MVEAGALGLAALDAKRAETFCEIAIVDRAMAAFLRPVPVLLVEHLAANAFRKNICRLTHFIDELCHLIGLPLPIGERLSMARRLRVEHRVALEEAPRPFECPSGYARQFLRYDVVGQLPLLLFCLKTRLKLTTMNRHQNACERSSVFGRWFAAKMCPAMGLMVRGEL